MSSRRSANVTQQQGGVQRELQSEGRRLESTSGKTKAARRRRPAADFCSAEISLGGGQSKAGGAGGRWAGTAGWIAVQGLARGRGNGVDLAERAGIEAAAEGSELAAGSAWQNSARRILRVQSLKGRLIRGWPEEEVAWAEEEEGEEITSPSGLQQGSKARSDCRFLYVLNSARAEFWARLEPSVNPAGGEGHVAAVAGWRPGPRRRWMKTRRLRMRAGFRRKANGSSEDRVLLVQNSA